MLRKGMIDMSRKIVFQAWMFKLNEIPVEEVAKQGYTDSLSYNQMQDVCGDGWTVDVIAHIFKGLKDSNN